MWDHKWEELWHCGAPEVHSLYQRRTFTDFYPSDHNDLTAEGMRACLYDKQEHFLINHGKTLSPLFTTHPVLHLSSLRQWTEILPFSRGQVNWDESLFNPFKPGVKAHHQVSNFASLLLCLSYPLAEWTVSHAPTPNVLSPFTQASKKEALAMTTQETAQTHNNQRSLTSFQWKKSMENFFVYRLP